MFFHSLLIKLWKIINLKLHRNNHLQPWEMCWPRKPIHVKSSAISWLRPPYRTPLIIANPYPTPTVRSQMSSPWPPILQEVLHPWAPTLHHVCFLSPRQTIRKLQSIILTVTVTPVGKTSGSSIKESSNGSVTCPDRPPPTEVPADLWSLSHSTMLKTEVEGGKATSAFSKWLIVSARRLNKALMKTIPANEWYLII